MFSKNQGLADTWSSLDKNTPVLRSEKVVGTLLDLNVIGRAVLILGGGSVAERKALKFVEAASKVTVLSKSFTKRLREVGEEGRVNLIEIDAVASFDLIRRLVSSSDIVVAATGDHRLNKLIVDEAKRTGALTNAADDPEISDFTMPALKTKGTISLAVSTGGKSPAMAKILLERLERSIREEDVLMVRLMESIRHALKGRLENATIRRVVLYRVIRDRETRRMLKKGKPEEARMRVERIIDSFQKGRGADA